MNVYIDSSPIRTGHSGRGIGQYTRMLIKAIQEYSDIKLVNKVDEAEVVHYPFFDLFFLTLPLTKSKPTVVTVHDVIPLLYPDYYPKGIRGSIKQMIQTMSLAGAKRIITDSNCSTDDVIKFLKQPQEKVKTVYLAPDPEYNPATKQQINEVKNKYSLNKPYFLYVGDINYNKNLPELLKAFSELPTDHILVMVSKALNKDNPAARFLWKKIDVLGIESRLRILNDVPQTPLDEMRGLYSGAFWYVQPSLYEGFGLPVLEAQACECPVISTKGGSLKEIAGSSCLEFDLFKSVEDVDRNQFIRLGQENVNRFSWQKTVEKMREIYDQAVQ